MDAETALLVVCPDAERAVGDQRFRLDRAAQVGVPPHVTVAYPFKADLGPQDHEELVAIFQSFPAFVLRGEGTGWFGDAVVFVEPVDPAPLIALTDAVQRAFPAYPIYGGVFDDVVPHLTIGHDHPVEMLHAAERTVLDRLPFTQVVDHVEFWSGPPLATAPAGSWRHVRDYPLGAAAHDILRP